MKISACWIAKNEEKNLARSIESVREASDELIVVDTGSEDGTVRLAEDLGAKVARFEWADDFSAARNYALSLCTGEAAIFIDADEWFEPALALDDRKELEKIFTANPGLEAIQIPIHNLNDSGAVKSVSLGNRILRKKPGLGFQKRVHEQFLRNNGAIPAILSTEKWKLGHSGYVEEILDKKMARNILLLEEAAEKSQDPIDRHLQHLYLVREYFQTQQTENCLRHLKLALREPETINRQYMLYGVGIVPLIYSIIKATAELREHVSRREIRRKIIEPFKKYLPDYPGAATIDLYYNALFGLKDEYILAETNKAIAAARKLPTSPMLYYLEAESVLNLCAAEASLKRGKSSDAFEYALNSFNEGQKYEDASLRLLLNCLRGQPPEEIVLFLNRQFGPEQLGYVTNGTRIEGFQAVHTYYLSRKINAGIATKGEYLYFLLLCGKADDSVKASLELYDKKNAGVVKRNLFLAAICSNNEKIYRDNSELLKEYAHILDPYFAGTVLEKINPLSLSIFAENFPAIAFAAGFEKAERLAGIYRSQNLFCHQIKTKYLVDNGLYSIAIKQMPPDPEDRLSEILLFESLVMTGNANDAIGRISRALEEGRTDSKLLSYLQAAAYRCPQGPLKSRAESLYEIYMPLYDKYTDLNDVVRTGYAVDDSDKKKQKSFKTMTAAQFNRRLRQEAEKPDITGLPELYEKAGAVYDEQGMPAAAAECYISALAKNLNIDKNRNELVRLFKLFGNFKLASAIEQTV